MQWYGRADIHHSILHADYNSEKWPSSRLESCHGIASSHLAVFMMLKEIRYFLLVQEDYFFIVQVY